MPTDEIPGLAPDAQAAIKSYVEAQKSVQAAEAAKTVSQLKAMLEADGKGLGIVVETWKTTIEVQEHFNQIGMQVRNFALSLLLAVLGAAALSLEKGLTIPIGPFGAQPLATLILCAGTVILAGFFYIDRHWYHHLLAGAVKHGEEIEKSFGALLPSLTLTRTISKESRTTYETTGQRLWLLTRAVPIAVVIILALYVVWPNWGFPRSPLGALTILAAVTALFLGLGIALEWQMKARYRLDFFYGLLISLLVVLVVAVTSSVRQQSYEEQPAIWYGFEERGPGSLPIVELGGRPRFESLRACMAWGKQLNPSVTKFECSKDCTSQDNVGSVNCKDTSGSQSRFK